MVQNGFLNTSLAKIIPKYEINTRSKLCKNRIWARAPTCDNFKNAGWKQQKMVPSQLVESIPRRVSTRVLEIFQNGFLGTSWAMFSPQRPGWAVVAGEKLPGIRQSQKLSIYRRHKEAKSMVFEGVRF